MLPVPTGRRVWVLAIALVAAFALAWPAASQSTGMVKGKVVDGKDQPVEKAKVTIEFKEGITRRHEVTTNKKGEFIQIGLPPGNYSVTAEKEGLGSQSFDARVRLGDATEVNFRLVPGGAGVTMTKEEAARNAALKAVFEEGVAASKAGDHDTAILKFQQAAEQLTETTKEGAKVEKCYDCWYNIGYAYAQKKDYAQSESAFKKALEIKPDYVDAYNGLATVYNAQKRFDDAAAASQKAVELAAAGGGTGGGGGGNVDALYNQGVINWNAGKIAEAQKCFEDAIKADPNHADSHYQLGMALLNQGKMPEALAMFETYLKLAPEGQFAAKAKDIVSAIKK
ncbi:MAG: tetratricopeptide repeat protein [Vicinamibacterales bacterium]